MVIHHCIQLLNGLSEIEDKIKVYKTFLTPISKDLNLDDYLILEINKTIKRKRDN